MIHRSAKTAAILAAFMALNGTAALIVGCGQEKQVQGEKLTDENGRTYYLIKNPDGTETARYENGEEVTFRRDENDNLHYISGMSNLLPLMMMSYFMFHGMGGWLTVLPIRSRRIRSMGPMGQSRQVLPISPVLLPINLR